MTPEQRAATEKCYHEGGRANCPFEWRRLKALAEADKAEAKPPAPADPIA